MTFVDKNKKKVGLTLGGGGARGIAHIGIYKYLVKNDIKPDIIVGCSMGAVIGACIAQGKDMDNTLDLVEKFASKHLFKISNFEIGTGGFLNEDKVDELLKALIPEDLRFENLKIPFAVNAVNVETGDHVVFDKGNVLKAVKASCAIPGIFKPVFINGCAYVDGGVVNAVPVDVCRGMGAEVIIAVDLKSYVSQQNVSALIYHFYMQKKIQEKAGVGLKENLLKETKLKLAFPIQVLLRSASIAERKLMERVMSKINPEVILHPHVSNFGLLDFENFQAIYEAGRDCAISAIPAIRKVISA